MAHTEAPDSTFSALFTIGAGLIVGIAAGVVSGRRWAALVAVVAFIPVFELARMGTVGPTVDAIHLDSLYGAIAFVTGRVVHGLLAVVPMTLGGVYGVALVRRLGHGPGAPIGLFGRAVTGLATVGLAALAAVLAIPATTSPIFGPDGKAPDGSIAELITVPIGGHEQSIMIRGRDTANPVLLYLAGGPGGTDLGAV
jgi:uncharacterized membrane protein (Fun14 family)